MSSASTPVFASTKRSAAIFALWVLGVSVVVPAPARAQLFGSDDSSSGSTLSSTSGTTTSSLVTTAGVVITLVLMTPETKKRAALAQYLQQNAAQVQQDMSAGAGPSMHDLGAMFATKTRAERQAFGALLRRERRQLAALISADGVSDARAGEFATIIHEAMRRDDALARAVARLQPTDR